MDDRLSALADGELAEADSQTLFGQLRSNADLRMEWDTCHLIGDALRTTPRLDVDFTARVMEALLEEPIVLAPPVQKHSPLLRNALAMAASVAGVAVVSAVVWSGREPANTGYAGLPIAQGQKSPAVLAASNMQEYLVAHQTHAPDSAVQGGPRYIRTVTVERVGNTR